MKNFEISMNEFKREIERARHAIIEAAGVVEDNENLKEYLIEAGLWVEDYTGEVNVAEYILNEIMGSIN